MERLKAFPQELRVAATTHTSTIFKHNLTDVSLLDKSKRNVLKIHTNWHLPKSCLEMSRTLFKPPTFEAIKVQSCR